ncbi:MAG: sigma-70 family RNA polymerase sigma factor [Planctomycetes bacterium]|nr:sigma-70 family RNA polymerase sigma factor [Planctomycetota bacterium]
MSEASDPAVDELVQRHLAALRAFVRLRMGAELRAREESCDIVQSVAREVLRHRDRFRHGGERGFREWLFTTASRKVSNRLKRWRTEKRSVARERPAELPSQLAGLSPSPSRHASAREELVAVEAAFDLLTPEQRDIVTMSRLLGMGHGEIAARLDKSEVAVRKILSRAVARLVAALASADAAGEA